eukprot:5357060-Pleurochrysis_carterae.AAC.1
MGLRIKRESETASSIDYTRLYTMKHGLYTMKHKLNAASARAEACVREQGMECGRRRAEGSTDSAEARARARAPSGTETQERESAGTSAKARALLRIFLKMKI